MRKILTTTLLLASTAAATDLEIGVGLTCDCPHFRAEITRFQIADSTTLLAGASDQAAWLGAETAFDLGVAGNVTAALKASYTWQQKYRVEGRLSGVLGSKATVNVNAHYGTASLSHFDQFQAFSLHPETDRAGFGVELDGKYRLDRQWTLTAEGSAGIENHAQLGASFREGQNEYRMGGLWQKTRTGHVFGATGGVTLRDGNSIFTLDALAGMRGQSFVWGGKATMSAFEVEDFFNSDVKIFAAYEPYRDATFAFRYGLETVTPLDHGQLNFGLYFTEQHYALQASYKFTLDPEPAEEETAEE
ncbi:hypothetical protein [Deinococcus cellulosilyticus]|uniref:Uncharacterized protein n=1 Tax=Deinococcus cellulosilyticus (strain DSM 18568 / NBRC 106333 / KACC 11606 / 5516J-15) TaxID=1223518 RepID=A0A511N9U7_DEIC1|nr:hypothetical protein [Deinococcus cellulosilyticus]GEM49602.1 hypothetical protein DC3_52370 [Deinococcus cellulosilyticus NBRC 106333 = KACC 11606]